MTTNRNLPIAGVIAPIIADHRNKTLIDIFRTELQGEEGKRGKRGERGPAGEKVCLFK